MIDPALQQQLDAFYNPKLKAANDAFYQAMMRSDPGAWSVNSDIQGMKDRYAQAMDYGKTSDFGLGQFGMLKDFIDTDSSKSSTAQQAISEYLAGQQQLASQNQQLKALQDSFATQEFGSPTYSLANALTTTAGNLGNLNAFLGDQEARTFNEQLKPLIQMQLGSQGLSNSGAQVELQSKALAGLQQSREQAMMQAALGDISQLQGMQQAQTMGNIGLQQQLMGSQADLGRMGVTMSFQKALEDQRKQLAQKLASYGGGSSTFGGIMGGIQGALGGAMSGFSAGGPWGAVAGGILGGGLGAYGGTNGQSSSLPLGSALGQGAGSFFTKGTTATSGGNYMPMSYSTPYGSNPLNLSMNPVNGGWS